MADIFDKLQGTDSSGDVFDTIPTPDEPAWKNAIRWASQPVQGFLATTGPGLATGFWELLGHGEVFDPEEIEHLKEISEREGIPFDEEKYLKAAQDALEVVPSVGNIARKVEKETGIPLEPKTRGQKALNFFTQATRLSPKGASFRGMETSLPKPVLGAGVTGAKEGLEEAGLPSPISDLLSFGVLKIPPEGSPSISIGAKKKPSGLIERRFEDISHPIDISAKKHKKINEKVEKEFRDLSEKIIEDSPISETYHSLKNDVTFKQASRDAFKDVEKLSEEIPEILSTKDLKKQLVDDVVQKKGTGFTPSEYDKTHKQYIKQFLKETPDQNISLKDLVVQYRKNNEALAQAYEPGKSFAFNRGKRQALGDYNRSIASLIEKKFPDTEFSNLFKETNKRWSEIKDAESIDKFLNGLFDGKIRFQKGHNLFDKEGMSVPFKRAMGEQGFKDFEQLMKDLMSTEKAHSLMNVAKSKGFKDLAETGLAFVLHPKIGYARLLYKGSKAAYKGLFEALIDKPKLAVTWDKGIKAFKKADFKTAEKAFNEIKKESESIKPSEILKPEKNVNASSSRNEEIEIPSPKQIEAPKKQLELKKEPQSEIERKAALKKFKDKKKKNNVNDNIKKYEALEKPLEAARKRGDKAKVEKIMKHRNKLIEDESVAENIVKKVKERSDEIKKNDFSKEGLKSQKQFLLNKIHKAKSELSKGKDQEIVNFKVPGDGEFNIKNNSHALDAFEKGVEKNWPDKPLKESDIKRRIKKYT